MIEKMKDRFLVANPFGVFLVRCDTIEEINAFVDEHLERCKENYIVLEGRRSIKRNDYEVRDLTEIATFDELNIDMKLTI